MCNNKRNTNITNNIYNNNNDNNNGNVTHYQFFLNIFTTARITLDNTIWYQQ